MSLCFTAEQVYEAAQMGQWKALDPEECGCGGSGWFLSDLDTWHPCHIHNDCDCCHPEYSDGPCMKDWQGPIQQAPAPNLLGEMDESIPF